jgi:hypothetical protein
VDGGVFGRRGLCVGEALGAELVIHELEGVVVLVKARVEAAVGVLKLIDAGLEGEQLGAQGEVLAGGRAANGADAASQ